IRRSFVTHSLLSFNAPAPTALYTLSLHDALPILGRVGLDPDALEAEPGEPAPQGRPVAEGDGVADEHPLYPDHSQRDHAHHHRRSEEHTSELQSRFDLVCRLLLEKKNNKIKQYKH